MRASLRNLQAALGDPGPPEHVWQEPLDDDPGHYARLCRLAGDVPDSVDLVNYALDLRHMEIQPDLLRYLLPICLQAWRQDLMASGESRHAAFVEYFYPALARRPGLLDVLREDERSAVTAFIRDAILDRMDLEQGLSFSGSGASPYMWFYSLGSFAAILPALADLWRVWWSMQTPAHALCGLQYISCMMYPEDRNPIFSPWTPSGGGGPPGLREVAGDLYGQEAVWRPENVAFLRNTLSVDYVLSGLAVAASIAQPATASQVPSQMLRDLPRQQALLEHRIAVLPTILSSPSPDRDLWTPPPQKGQ